MDQWHELSQSGDCGSYEGHSLLGKVEDEADVLLKQGATLYSIQLGLNLIWMPLFFVLKRPIEATVDIGLLTATTGYLTYVWSQVDELAAWSIAPYLGWLGFATYLSVSGGRACQEPHVG